MDGSLKYNEVAGHAVLLVELLTSLNFTSFYDDLMISPLLRHSQDNPGDLMLLVMLNKFSFNAIAPTQVNLRESYSVLYTVYCKHAFGLITCKSCMTYVQNLPLSE